MTITNDAEPIGRISSTADGEPAQWLVYFAVDDLAAALTTVKKLRETVLAGAILTAL